MKKTARKILSMALVIQLVLSVIGFTYPVSAATVNRSRMLKASGNKIVLEENPNTVVRLTGVNICGGEWTGTPGAERLTRSAKEAMENWDTNLIRLPVSINGWTGNYSYVTDKGVSYKAYIDSVISMASEAGKYVVLDLHQYKWFDNQAYLDFWTEAATKYKNNPTVLFGILNEPNGTTWPIWRNGNGSNVTGHQQVVEMIRNLGAKNIIVAGGLDWAYDLKGIVGKASGDTTVYALVDQGSNNDLTKTGNGIMYDVHIYPWKGTTSSWDSATGTARKLYPILIGECGWQATDVSSGKAYTPGSSQYYDKWNPELFKWMNDESTYGNLANWTGWSFHPSAAPNMLADGDRWKYDAVYAYPPTDTWGIFAKQELKKDLGFNVALGKTVTSSAYDAGFANTNAVDDNPSTLYASSAAGDKYLTVDLWSYYDINRWVVRHAGTETATGTTTTSTANTKDFKLQVSNDKTTWTDVDVITGNTNNITDRFIQPVTARYVRLYVTQAAQSDNNLKIYEFSVFGKETTVVPDPTLPTNVVGNAGRGTISKWYAAQNFEGATNEIVAGAPNAKAIKVPNLANNDYIRWDQDTTKTSNFYTVKAGDTANTSNHILGINKANIPIEMTVDTHDVNGTATAAPAVDSGQLIYADMRIKRVSVTDDPVSLKLMDSSGNDIFEVSFTSGAIPQLIANQTYGSLTLNPMSTAVSYPYTTDWVYLRARIDFASKTFELYQGPTINTMVPFVTGTTTFGFKNTNAANLYKIYAGSNGAFGFDDVNIYSVSTPFAPATHAVTFKVDSTILATKTVDEGAALTDMPIVPIKAGYTGAWDAPVSTIITADKTVNAVYTVIPKVVQTNMNSDAPAIWSTSGGTTAAYVDGKAEDGYIKALHMTGGSGGGVQFALTAGGFSNFVGFNAFRFRVKSTSAFQMKMQAENRVTSITTTSKLFTIPSTGGVWTDITIPASDLKPDVDGDWIYNMKTAYTTNFEPVILMKFEGMNLGASDYATIGNMSALWAPPTTHTVSFIANGVTTATRTVYDGATLTDIPAVPSLTGFTGAWDTTNYTNITDDKTVTAVYTPITCKVTFIANGTTTATKTVNYGATLTDIPAVPVKTGYTGVWDTTDYTGIIADKTVTAVYTPIPIVTHTVTFLADSVMIATKTVNDGTTLTDIPAVPAKEGYIGGWNPSSFTNITSDITATAVYAAIPPDKLSIGTITMSGPVDGQLTFNVPYTAIDMDHVTIIAEIGSGDTEPTTITDTDIAYINQQAATGISSFSFKVRESKFTTQNNKIFIKIGGTGIDAPKLGAPLTYPSISSGQTYTTTATVSVINGVVNVSYSAQNNSTSQSSACVVVALYDNNNKLIGIQTNTDLFAASQLKSFNYLKDCTNLNYSYFQVFVLNNLSNIEPLSLVYDSRQ